MAIDLFSKYKIGKMELKNRFARSATWDATANEDGSVTEKSISLYQALAEGGVGLIITGHIFVERQGKAGAGQYGIHSNEMIPGLKKLTDTVHKSGARIAAQLAHAGLYSLEREETAKVVSEIPQVKRLQHEMTDSEISELIETFAVAAKRSVEAGFDAIQLHGAHGYLMSQFLSPLYNRRNDRWGGTAEKRRAFHIELLKAVKKAVGKDIPVFIKLGIMDEKDGGLTIEEGLETVKQMEKEGLDGVEVSLGFGTAIRTAPENDTDQAYFRDLAATIKKNVSIPVMAVGGIRTLKTAQDIINGGQADMISMCRPFICEPDIISRWRQNPESPAGCISCGKCFGNAVKYQMVSCRKNQK
jgi:2,4-dienoyl-CoA reductase-like NADH-dependent reductase (Old Yellow Enzyme family)